MRSILVKAVIFDMDGVLTESMKYHIISWKYAFNQFNIFPTDNDLAMLEGMSYKETINFLSEKYSVKLTDRDKEKVYSLKKEKLEKIFRYNLYPYVLKILTVLKKKNIKLALVSGANKKFVYNIVRRFFEGFFEIIITGSDVKKGKPDPEPYLKAVKKLRCLAGNVIVIENAPLGIESSKKANLKTCALTTTLNKKYLKLADRIFISHKELFSEIKCIILAQ